MLLGERSLQKKLFSGLDTLLKPFEKESFKALPESERTERVSRSLLEWIQKQAEPCFLLAAVLEFIEAVSNRKILEQYTFSAFELWLNQMSSLSAEENFRIRAKIAGKWVDRSAYQVFFPIGMGKTYEGTHFVTAHRSPDLDTTVASFWGWVDAFAARVGDSLHVWNLPGGPPPSQIEIDWLFRAPFGAAVFTHLSKARLALHLTSLDLMTQEGMLRKGLSDSIGSSDHERDHNAVVVVDEEGFYLGDWRNVDVEGVRGVIILLSACLRWFENNLHLQLISLLAKKDLKLDEVKPWLLHLFTKKLHECEPAVEFSQKQRKEVDRFIRQVLEIPKGLEITFEDVSIYLAKLGEIPFEGVDLLVKAMRPLFDVKGRLLEERPQIFTFLEKAVRGLHDGILKIRNRLEKLDIALKTKWEVFGQTPTFVTARSEIEEIRQKMGSYTSLTVLLSDQGKMFPLGIIPASDLNKNVLGTVSLRDFCNREEMGIPAYLDVISVIDHHKSQLQTFSPPFAVIADAQSCNTLVANQAFLLNDRYSIGTLSMQQIDEQLSHADKTVRLEQRLLQKRLAGKTKGSFYIHPEREFTEYLHFLYGILDDTDLLSKVSLLDVECVASLLNRLKSLSLGREVEIIALDDIPRDASFLKTAVQRILQNEDMYSLYKKVYAYREKEVEGNMALAAKNQESNFFADTKEQNGCCQIGQTKMFASNIAFYQKQADAIRKAWLSRAAEVHKNKGEIDLHIHMMSTIVSADEVYKGKPTNYTHQDELWIWIPPEDGLAIEHLKRFLNAFQRSTGLKNNALTVEFSGDNAEVLKEIFKESFLDIERTVSKRGLPIAILHCRAGSLNSRKAMVSPFLPRLSS